MTKRKKISFANALILLCVVVCTIVTAFLMVQSWRLREMLTSGQLGVIFGFFGGELLIVALRQIFGSDVVTKAAKSETIYDEDLEGSV